MLRRALLRLVTRVRRPGAAGILSMLPDTVLVALRRENLDPLLDHSEGAVRRVSLPWGFRGWLVTGYDEVRLVLADHHSYSNGFGNLVARAGVSAGLDPGGPGSPTRRNTPACATCSPHTSPPIGWRRSLPASRRSSTQRSSRWHNEYLPTARPTSSSSSRSRSRVCYHLRAPGSAVRRARPLPTTSTARFDVVDGASSSLDAVAESLAYLEDLVRRRRREPGPGLVSGLVADHGSELS